MEATSNGGGGALAIAGGYGVVGAQVARLLRRRHPDLPLVLAGRRPEVARLLAWRLGARTVEMDVTAASPLAALPERPAAVLAAVSDPADRLLADCVRSGIPIVDLNRGASADLLAVAIQVAWRRPSSVVMLAGGWMGGVAPLLAAAAAAHVWPPERIDISALLSVDDRVGPDSWGFSERWTTPFQATADGRRRELQPLTGMRSVACADGQRHPSLRVGTLEQATLPALLGVPTVETRMALDRAEATWGLWLLKRSGSLRALARPPLRPLRRLLLEGSGEGGPAGVSARATRAGRTAGVDAHDPLGQAHLTAAGAVVAVERALGLDGSPRPAAGLAFPEQAPEPERALGTLRDCGVRVTLNGIELAHPPSLGLEGRDAWSLVMPSLTPATKEVAST